MTQQRISSDLKGRLHLQDACNSNRYSNNYSTLTHEHNSYSRYYDVPENHAIGLYSLYVIYLILFFTYRHLLGGTNTYETSKRSSTIMLYYSVRPMSPMYLLQQNCKTYTVVVEVFCTKDATLTLILMLWMSEIKSKRALNRRDYMAKIRCWYVTIFSGQ